MADDELKEKALESYWRSAACGSLSSKKCYILGFIAGTKIAQEENEELKQQLAVVTKNRDELLNEIDRLEERVAELSACY